MTTGRQLRVTRAAAAASVATFVALLSHVVAGGEPPALVGVLLVWAVSLVVATLLVGRRLSVARLSLTVVAAQVLFHTFFIVCAPAASATSARMHHAASHHAAHMPLAESIGQTSDALALSAASGLMWLAHVLAAVLTVVLLHRGERLVITLIRQADRLARRMIRLLAPPALPAGQARMRAPIPSSTLRLPHPLIVAPARRGPPVLLSI